MHKNREDNKNREVVKAQKGMGFGGSVSDFEKMMRARRKASKVKKYQTGTSTPQPISASSISALGTTPGTTPSSGFANISNYGSIAGELAEPIMNIKTKCVICLFLFYFQDDT